MKKLKLITILCVAILISLPSLAFAKGKPLSGKGKNKAWDTCYKYGDNTGVYFIPAELIIAISEYR